MSTPFKRGFLQWMKAPHRCCALLSIRIVTIQYPLSHYERKLIRLLCSTIRNLFAKATLLAELTWRRPGWRPGHRSIRGSFCLTMVSLECRNVRCRIYLFTFHEQINVIIRKDKIVVTKHIVFHCEERKQAAVLALQATGREVFFFFFFLLHRVGASLRRVRRPNTQRKWMWCFIKTIDLRVGSETLLS